MASQNVQQKQVFACVRKDLYQNINFGLKEIEKHVALRYFAKTRDVDEALSRGQQCCALILDCLIDDKSTIKFARALKEKLPNLRILFVAASDTKKEDIIDLISSKIVSGVLLMPFTATQVDENICKLCGIQKGAQPWFMQTKIRVK